MYNFWGIGIFLWKKEITYVECVVCTECSSGLSSFCMGREVKDIIGIGKGQDLDSINSSIVNTGRINRDGIKKHSGNP